MKVIYNMKNRMNQEFQHCLKSWLIEEMKNENDSDSIRVNNWIFAIGMRSWLITNLHFLAGLFFSNSLYVSLFPSHLHSFITNIPFHLT
jgi:hypothetical protein